MKAKKPRNRSPASRLSPSARWAVRVGVALFTPLLLIGVIEIGLRIFGYGFPTHLFVKTSDGARFGINEKFLFSFYSGNAAKGKIQPTFIAATKPGGTTRIFVLGESAAQGTPEPAFGFVRILEFMLHSQFPQQQFEVVNVGMRGVNSHILLPAARDCARQSPDVFVLYIGNNEVVGLHAPGPDATIVDRHLTLSRASYWAHSLRFGQWIARVGEESKLKAVPKQDMDYFRQNRIAFDDPARQIVYRHFQQNLEDICRAAQGSGAKTILSTIAVNLKDFPPIGSLHRGALTSARETEWEALYAKGIAAETNHQYESAIELFLAAARLDDHYAELQFRLARSYEALGKFDDSRRHYALACDWDAMAFRADSKINEVIRQTAANRQNGSMTLVDAEQVFSENDSGAHGIPGENFFHDHVHLNFDGDYLLAKTLFPAVVAALGKSPAPVPSRAQCAEALAFTKWGELQIDAGVAASGNQPPYLDQLEHAQRQARNEQAINARRQQITQADLQQAAATFTAALVKNPQDWHLHQLYGIFALDQGEFKTAVDHLSFPVTLFPDNLRARINYASALARAGQHLEAIAQFKEALRIDPGNDFATQALSWLYTQRR
jgi:tetratricopeptide (TPR) repeat protein